MPSRWQILLPGLDAARVRPEHVHAVISSWFDRSAEDHSRTAKPYSVSMARPVAAGAHVEIGLLDDTLVDRLHTRAAQGVRLRLGNQHATVDRTPVQLAGVPWAGLQTPTNASSWWLTFRTPTTFRRGNSFTPTPGIRPILGSLRRSWQVFAPATLPPLALELDPEPVWPTDIDVASRPYQVDGRVVSAFTGRLRVVCDADPGTAGAVDRLLRLAPYSGVGAHTTRGFGLVRIDPGNRRLTGPTSFAIPNRATGVGADHR